MRVAAYSDLEYFAREGRVVTEESFLIFMTELRASFNSLVVLGRLRDDPGVAGAYTDHDDLTFAVQ